MFYPILSIHQPLWVKSQFAESVHYSLHSKFTHAINFVDNRSQMITFLSKDLPNAPNTAVVGCMDFDELNITENATLVLSISGFQLGNLFFELSSHTQMWPSELPRLSAPNIASTQKIIEHFLFKHCEELSAIEKIIYEKLDALYLKISQAYNDNDLAIVAEMIKESIGLGLGLTPSGDDRLVGFLLGCYAFDFNKIPLLESIQQTIDNAKDRTNDISYAMLKEARNGEFNEWLIDLIKASNSGDQRQLDHVMEKVFSIGSRSGGDMLKGFSLFLLLQL